MTPALLPMGVAALLLLSIAAGLGLACLYRQLRQHRQQVQALQQTVATLGTSLQQAERANRLKGQFLGHLGHEIRTPLNAFIGLLELVLQRTEAGSANRGSLELALGAASDLRELLGDLLDISRIESGQLQLNPAWICLSHSAEAVLGVFQALARQKNLYLSLEFQAPSPEPQVLVDGLRFKQILTNLLSNALKFTRQGKVQVKLQLLPAARPGHFDLLLRVLDTGIGIPPQERQRLLQPFAQVEPTSQSPRDSSGLGLPISHQLCLQMGGSLSLHGRTGPGCEVQVRLTLPGRTAVAPRPVAATPAAAQRPLDVLLADDHPASLTLLQGQLEHLGHRVTCAGNGLQAYQLWREGDFDLLIVDCNMPLMNGYQLAEAIRRSEGSGPAVNLIGCSASNDPQTHQRGLDAGMHDCLCKPLGLELLGSRLATLCPLPRPDSFSIEALFTLTHGKPQLVRSMLEKLSQCCREDRHLLGRIPPDDFTALLELAHKIRGSALMVRATPLQNCCEDLERACLERAGTTVISTAVRALDLALIRLAQSLHRHLEGQAQSQPAPSLEATQPASCQENSKRPVLPRRQPHP